MSTTSRKATVYFDPALHDALRERAAAGDHSVSSLVNDAVRAFLDGPSAEPEATSAPEAAAPTADAPKAKKNAKKGDGKKPEKTVPFKRFVKKLKARGKL